MSSSPSAPSNRASDLLPWQADLLTAAIRVREMAYAPYSGFRVGAALLTRGGEIFTGCNIENAAYSPTNCAERTAFFKAISEGKRQFVAMAIVGGRDALLSLCAPCGVCRQVMAEFCQPDFLLILGTPETPSLHTLDSLLPFSFTPHALDEKQAKDGPISLPKEASQ